MIKELKRILIMALILTCALAVFMPQSSEALAKKPEQVTSIKVKSVTYQSVSLAWKKSKYATAYVVYRADEKNGKYQELVRVKKNALTDKKLQTGKAYWYKIQAINKSRKAKKSPRISALPKLDTPKLKLKAMGEGVYLYINKVAGANGYIVFRDGKELLVRKSSEDMTYLDSDVPADKQTHGYTICAFRYVDSKVVASDVSRKFSAVRPKIKVTLDADGNKNIPNLMPGKAHTIKGKITSNTTINTVKIGVVSDETKTWAPKAKYTQKNVSIQSFDIAKADESVRFGKLDPGKYHYKIVVRLVGGTTQVVKNQAFTVKGTKGALAAVKWAKAIAADNSFAYGTGSRAHHGGCYFCGTNVTGVKKAKAGSKWEKTYCCNPFIFAAYAHGAQDPAILAACQKGKCGGMEPKDWTRYGCFENIGCAKNISFSKLMPGDVIISDPSKGGKHNHVWMYCGDGQYVDAQYEGWGSGTIAVRSGAKNWYSKYYQRSGCYVIRYTGE